MTKALVIIPTFNEKATIEGLLPVLRSVASEADILIVDDSSPDGTGQTVKDFQKKDKAVYLLERPKKDGLGKAYQAGMTWALARDYDPIVTMDADFSHNPIDVPRLIRISTQDVDIVVGSRYVSGGKISGWAWDRYLLSNIARWLARLLLHLRTQDVTAGFKVYRRSYLKEANIDTLVSSGYMFQVEMILRAERQGKTIKEIPITFQDRTVGRSKVSRHELLTSMRSLLILASTQAFYRQFGKFGIVGIINFIVDFSVTNLLVLVGGWHPRWAGYSGTLVALLNSYYWNRRWTFRLNSYHHFGQFLRFFMINGTGALINASAYTFLLEILAWHYNWAKIGAIGAGIFWNFFGTKYWVFPSQVNRHDKN